MKIFGLEIKAAETPADLLIQEQRSSLANPSPWLVDALGAAPSAAGISVNEESAMRIAAVYACVSLIAESVASLPLKLYRRTAKGREVASDHPLYNVVHHRANGMQSAYQAREVGAVNLLLFGDAFYEKQHNAAGDVIALWPIPSSLVTVEKINTSAGPRRLYRVSGLSDALPQEAILHVPGLGYDGLRGKSPIRLMREGLSIALAAERFGARFYSNDARSGVLLETDQILGDKQYERLVEQWQHNAGSDNAWRTKILEAGLKASTLGMPAADSQFLEARKYQRTEVCGIYRVPPHMIADVSGSTSWGSGIEQQSIGFLQYTLRSWLVRFEQAMNTQLLSPSEEHEYYFEHAIEGMLRADQKTRFEAYAIGKQWGFISTNQIARLENWEETEGGDDLWRPLNMVPVGEEPTGDQLRMLGVSRETSVSSERTAAETTETREDRSASRLRSASALLPVFGDTLKRVIARDAAEIRKAWKKHETEEAFVSWLIEHARSQAEWATPRLLPVFAAMASAMMTAAKDELGSDIRAEDLDEFVQNYTAAAANRLAGSSRAQVLVAIEKGQDVNDRLDEWADRYEHEAESEMHRSSNALTKAAWAVAGVTAIVWKTRGSDTCDYCQTLDGKAVEITRSFVDAGGKVSDMTTSTNISHPPLHRGCSCSLEPQITSRRSLTKPEVRQAFEVILSSDPHLSTCCDH